MLKRVRMLQWIFIVPLLLGIAALAFKYQETRELTGHVRDAESNQPVAGAAIESAGQVTATDEQGKYTLFVPRGKLTVTAQADGYAPAQASVDASELMRRAVALDVRACPACGGRMRLIALIFDRQAVRAILDSSGVPASLADRAPPADPATALAAGVPGASA